MSDIAHTETRRAMAHDQPARPVWQRALPLVVLGGLLAAVIATGAHRELTIENLVAVRDRFQSVITAHLPFAVLAYITIYAGVVALSVPGALIFTLAGGLLFGAVLGGAAALTAALIGATLLFLIARSAFGESLRQRAGPAITGLVDGFRKDAFNYLLFLRLVPAVPFFLVNIASALLGVPLKTYIAATAIGMIPATFAFASIGAGLDSVVAAAKAEQAACIASRGIAACPLGLSASSLVTRDILIALVLLGLVALIPVALKKWTARHG
jgi:uncharacterized membrane protein YdjX (TVP38/TMEM64 family)